jgi:RNA polymerase sigma factor (sigma-70 family)
MTASEPDWDRLIAGLRRGDEAAIADFYRRHGAALRAIAERQIGAELRRRVAPSDVVQSAFRTFFRRANEGRFQFEDSEHLWNLMCAITLTKVREQARYHRRQRRDIRRESQPEPPSADGSPSFDVSADGEVSPDVAVGFADEFQRLMESLDDEAQQVVQLKLDDRTNDEIADALGMSERTVRHQSAAQRETRSGSRDDPGPGDRGSKTDCGSTRGYGRARRYASCRRASRDTACRPA